MVRSIGFVGTTQLDQQVTLELFASGYKCLVSIAVEQFGFDVDLATVFQLLLRFHDPEAGTITLDGHDLRDISLESLRRNVGVVLQDNVLFSGSILDNLRLKQAAGTLNPGDLEDLRRYLKADYNPDKDFLPPDLAKAAEAQLKARP